MPIKQAHLDAGRAVIAQEIEGLESLSSALGEEFSEAVDLIAGLQGKLIVSGMGKSGHVARKIAATLASTGSPAFFVHPGEASHGDLGMIGQGDAMLLLSNSGETAELGDMIHYATRFHIPLIAMVRRRQSILVEGATIALVLPETPEATPTGAPTTSTTMMMALGDALAVALIEARGFTKDDFGTFHPGGKLGTAYIRVKDLMHTREMLPLVAPEDKTPDVLLEMTSKGFGCAAVIEEGKLIGVITDGDLRRHMSDQLLNTCAKEIMTKDPLTIRPGAFASEALGLMNERSITSLFVLDEQKTPQGILHIHDCLRAGVA